MLTSYLIASGTVNDATSSYAVSTPLPDIPSPRRALSVRQPPLDHSLQISPRFLWPSKKKMAPVSKVDVALVSNEEIPTCVEVVSKAFGHDAPFIDIYFPNHDTPSGQAQASKRLVAWNDSGSSTFLKAIARADDGSQGYIIGIAIWTFMKEAPPAELSEAEDVEEFWPDEDDREFMTRLWKEYVIPRTQTIKESGGKGVYGTWKSMIRKRNFSDLAQAELSSNGGPKPQMSKESRPLSRGRQSADESMRNAAYLQRLRKCGLMLEMNTLEEGNRISYI
ncbi:hypothetical protein LA080_014347 [Diaporthe eres]|nr:hypothetical protein LA080_014347 [Diaporthe eres]